MGVCTADLVSVEWSLLARPKNSAIDWFEICPRVVLLLASSRKVHAEFMFAREGESFSLIKEDNILVVESFACQVRGGVGSNDRVHCRVGCRLLRWHYFEIHQQKRRIDAFKCF